MHLGQQRSDDRRTNEGTGVANLQTTKLPVESSRHNCNQNFNRMQGTTCEQLRVQLRGPFHFCKDKGKQDGIPVHKLKKILDIQVQLGCAVHTMELQLQIKPAHCPVRKLVSGSANFLIAPQSGFKSGPRTNHPSITYRLTYYVAVL